MDGIGTAAQFNGPAGICIDNYGTCYIAELNNDRLRKLALHSTCVSTLAGSIEGFSDGIGPMAMFNGPVGISVDNQVHSPLPNVLQGCWTKTQLEPETITWPPSLHLLLVFLFLIGVC